MTDAVVVACTGRGEPIKFSGTGTALGELIGGMVKDSLKDALEKQEGIVANRPLTQRLKERGILVADLATLFSETHPTICQKPEKIRAFEDELQQTLDDPEISQFVIAALRIDEDIKTGSIPIVASDRIPIGEVLQAAVVSYLGKMKKAQNAVKYERNPSLASRLGPVTRGVLSSIMVALYAGLND
jgi:hypothetical protein